MKYKVAPLFLLLALITSNISCDATKSIETGESSEIEKWKLGWRLVNSSLDKNYQLAEQQFDSLLKMAGRIDPKFLITGLDVLAELRKMEKISLVLSRQDQLTLAEICSNELFTTKLTDIQSCTAIAKDEVVLNKPLQLELIKMYINDQSVRGNVLNNIITKYNLGEYELSKLDMAAADSENRQRLKEIITEFGFPTRQLVGKDAMHGIFLIIQHSDWDKEWQREQLQNIAMAVKQGDVDGESYAYLYDRIKINAGERQLYGTQFKNVDQVNKKVELADTEDVENLDKRRMEVGMMPIQMYKQFMLRNLTE